MLKIALNLCLKCTILTSENTLLTVGHPKSNTYILRERYSERRDCTSKTKIRIKTSAMPLIVVTQYYLIAIKWLFFLYSLIFDRLSDISKQPILESLDLFRR